MTIPKAEGEVQQLARRDGPRGRVGGLERPVHPPQHAPLRKLGQQLIYRLVECDQPLANETQGRSGDDRLRRRRDPKERVARDGAPADRERSECLDVNLLAAGDEGDQSRHAFGSHVFLGHLTQPLEARRGEDLSRHARSP